MIVNILNITIYNIYNIIESKDKKCDYIKDKFKNKKI